MNVSMIPSRFAAGLLLALCTLLFPAKDANAMNAFEALDKVCGQLPDVCGSVTAYKGVVNGCFKGSDELACAVAIIDVASGGQASAGKAQLDAIVGCVKSGLPIKDTCKTGLEAAGVSAGQINEAYALVNKCAGIDDVDDAIVCADALLDSSIADDADLGIPTWVNSLFDIYMDLRDKDYWGLVYDVGATVACAVANYFTGTDVCAFLEDLAELAGDVADGAKAVGGALNNVGEKIFTGQTKHVPVVQFFNDYWLPEVDGYAKAIVVQQNMGYWNANIGEKFKHCRNYFDDHTMSEDKASRACSDMRDGTAASDNSFIDNGFTQLASRRGAIMLLPSLMKPAATTRIAQLRAQGAFKAGGLTPEQAAVDPWHGAAEVPGAEGFVYRLYGLGLTGDVTDSPPLNREAKTVNEAWRTKTVGYGAYMLIQAAKVAPATLNRQVSEDIAHKSLASGEAGIDFANEAKSFVQAAQMTRMKTVDQLVSLNKGLKESRDKPLNDALAMCAPKSTLNCDEEVRKRFAVCDEKAAAFYKANQSVIDNFDTKAGQDKGREWSNLRATCEADVRKYVEGLPNGSKLRTTGQIGAGAVPGQTSSGLQGTAQGKTATVAADANATKTCKPFLGRGDELLCADATGFAACKLQVDAGKMKTCRQEGSQQVYTKAAPAAAPAVPAPTPASSAPKGTGSIPLTPPSPAGAILSGGLIKPTATALAPPPAAKLDEAALKTCKLFLGRKDEMLCSDTRSFAACKVAVDTDKMKTCRMTGSTDVYVKH